MSAEPNEKRRFWGNSTGFALTVFLSAAAFYLWIEHRGHILGFVPLLLPLLICLGMHFFMHGSHDGRHRSDGGRDGG